MNAALTMHAPKPMSFLCVPPPFHIHRDAPMSISAYISRLPPPPKEQQIQVRARAVQQCSIHLGSLLPACLRETVQGSCMPPPHLGPGALAVAPN